MAPGFLSKFQRHPSNASKDRSVSFSRSPSPKEVQPPSISVTSLGVNTTNVPSRNPSGANTPDQDRLSVHTNQSGTQSVVIGVIPPSPHSTIHSDLSLPQETGQAEEAPPKEQGQGSVGKPALSFSASSKLNLSEEALITPTPANSGFSALKAAFSPSRGITPASSTGDLRQFVQQAEAHSSETMRFGDSANSSSAAIHRQPSEKSNRSQSIPAPIPISHGRAATSPAGGNNFDSISSSGGDDSAILSGMLPISESPTNSSSPPQSPPGFDIISRTQTQQTLSPSLLGPGGKDSDSISMVSTNGGKKKSKWRRSSKKKPTGLASAIAASGLAMANPAMTAPQIAQASQVQTPTTTSPTKQNGTTNQRKHSGGNHRHFTSASAASVGSNSLDTPKRSRARTLSTSNRSDNSENMYDSGLEGISSDEDGSESDDLDLQNDIPVTGFAVASNKRNADFHELFSNIPDGDYLIEDYGCALQREILIQGRIYISENHICFHANIFGWITDLSIPIYEIVTLEKKMTAFVIPNAIQITTRQAKYTFASFLSRDTTYDVIHNIWLLARPEDNMSAAGSPRGSLDNFRAGMDQARENGSLDGVNGAVNGVGGAAVAAVRGAKLALLKNKVTMCACGKNREHYTETALETVVPGTPDKIYNLMFASGFIKDFMKVDQKLLDIQISDWAPISPGSKLLARNFSYIKPLYASLGPKQTKCEIRDETAYCDFDDYVVTITTTRTPDVPSGGVFSVKTRTCIMWASAASTKVVVTTQVEWTGRSFIKGIIEKSAIDGQKVYHADLDRAMRVYIQQHPSEFVPEGIEAIAVAPIEAKTPSADETTALATATVVSDKTREKERNQRAFQWAYDTFEGAYNVGKHSTSGALELISDAWDQSNSTTILIFVIVILVFSNLYTLTMVGRREDVGRRKEMQKTQEKEKWVEGIVTALWEELAAGKSDLPLPHATSLIRGNWREEFANINKTLDAVEDRIRLIRETLNTLD